MTLNVLFTCAGRRNYLVNYFKEALNGNGKVIAADQSLKAPAMVEADIAIKVPNIYKDNYIESLLNIIETHNISAIVSLNDLELPILAKNRSKLENKGTKLIVSSSEVINTAFDKWETYKYFNKIGLHTPKTFITLESVKKALNSNELSFPLVLKPRWGSASIAIDYADTMEELELVYKVQKIKLKNSILNPASSTDFERGILIQEKIEGKEYGMDILNDFNGNYIGTFSREKLKMRSGETDIAMSIIDKKLSELGEAIGKNLKHIGNLDCDVFKIKNKYYILEVNPRFGGGYPFSHEAGVNIASIYIEWLKGNSNISNLNQYKAGKIFAKCDRLINISPNKS